ncbi:uncharacterized protein BJ171DRAFT_486531 [Polychytrium aggregatum]|uniref:uncharacterized protein n=1 Tax=Polychytrium aggregatum TaxID=110093 RepID=UPI0022FEF033|nr:uncharacterized protein BJ171DRAFT_486531 [Polychytrium aggregatum]KAI9209350.1 hypothetical protein BJ171DRAFT_486531 [Polychytrium aggregatum]
MQVAGATVIITGAASGFGKALAQRLFKKGANLLLTDISPVQFEPGDMISAGSNRFVSVRANVCNADEMRHAFQRALSEFGRIDIVVNNAGIAETLPFTKPDEASRWKQVIDVDLSAVVLGTKLALMHLLDRQQPGIIINVASLAGLYPQFFQPVYAAAKGGVVHFTRSLAPYNDEGIRVVALCPSFSPTPLLSQVGPDGRESQLKPEGLVPIELVIDAFIVIIENDKVKGGSCVRVTPQFGIDLYGIKGRSKL